MQAETEQRPSMGSETKRTVTNHAASALVSSAHVPHGLDWQAFSTTCFPGRRRHDLEALTAHGAYRRSDGPPAPARPRSATDASDARASEEHTRIEAELGPAGSTPLQDWEDEGGAALGVGALENAVPTARSPRD